MNERNVLKFENVTKRYGSTTALDSVSVDIYRGHVYALVGENGAGKSTMLRIVCGLSEPTSGKIGLFGKTGISANSERARLGYMPDESGSYFDLSAYDNLMVRSQEWGIDSGDINRLLISVGLDPENRRKVATYSLGMKRRLDLATALLGDPELLILDEPLNGLDPRGVVEMRGLINRVASRDDKALLISSHNLSELEKTASDFIFLSHGKLVECCSRKEVEESDKGVYSIKTPEAAAAKRAINASFPQYTCRVDKTGSLAIRGTEIDGPRVLRVLVGMGLDIEEATYDHGSLESHYLAVI